MPSDESTSDRPQRTALPIGVHALLGGSVEGARLELKATWDEELMQQTARVPFDDRRAFDASNEDLRLSLAREFLHDVGSELVSEGDAERVYSAMRMTARQNGHTVPRNIGLLFFSDDPQRWFRSARIELAEFTDDAGGDTIHEKTFKGPIVHQLRSCLAWLENMTTQRIQMQPDTPAAKTWVSYPFPALREALVNAVYHRSYEADVVEPTKVYLYPNRVEIISYPGPVDGIELAHLVGERPLPPVQARNRRIGELLKELKLAEARGTGLPKMRKTMERNGSPRPRFDFDEKRTYFQVTLPAHPEYVALTVLREHDYHKATGDDEAARGILLNAMERGLTIPAITGLLQNDEADNARPPPGDVEEFAQESLEIGSRLALKELHRQNYKEAHRLFSELDENSVRSHSGVALVFAQTKLILARAASPSTRHRLLHEAVELLERAVSIDAQAALRAEAWLGLATAKLALRHPRTDVERALEQALTFSKDDGVTKEINRMLEHVRSSREY
jgi:ATP-dependent DNA helicase RecG